MKKLYTLKDLEKMVAAGKPLSGVPADAMLTPSAKDFLKSASALVAKSPVPGVPTGAPIVPDYEYKWSQGTDPVTPEEFQAFFYSPEIEVLKRRMCDMGRRMWERGYTDGNGGNLTIRVGDNMVLCTPTLISKGFMKPEDMCLVDLEGKQLAGRLKRTSEVMTHIGIMKRQPAAKACCHAHPPHATAYAVAKVRPPSCLIPEAEVFLGVIGEAEYKTPGTPENADEVGRVAVTHQAVLMQNHGVITWGKDIEDAYWKMENTDAYCQTVLLASMLGRELTPIQPRQAKELIALRKQLGMEDYRENWKECELCDNTEFQPGFYAKNTAAKPVTEESVLPNDEAESVVQQITDQIFARMGKGGN